MNLIALGNKFNKVANPKVAISLTKVGWLVTTRGSGGGLMLAAHTPETRVGEIVRHTETSCDVAECFNPSRNTCPIIGVCRLKPILYRARKAFFDVLDSVTIGKIARNSPELNPILEASRSGRQS